MKKLVLQSLCLVLIYAPLTKAQAIPPQNSYLTKLADLYRSIGNSESYEPQLSQLPLGKIAVGSCFYVSTPNTPNYKYFAASRGQTVVGLPATAYAMSIAEGDNGFNEDSPSYRTETYVFFQNEITEGILSTVTVDEARKALSFENEALNSESDPEPRQSHFVRVTTQNGVSILVEEILCDDDKGCFVSNPASGEPFRVKQGELIGYCSYDLSGATPGQ